MKATVLSCDLGGMQSKNQTNGKSTTQVFQRFFYLQNIRKVFYDFNLYHVLGTSGFCLGILSSLWGRQGLEELHTYI